MRERLRQDSGHVNFSDAPAAWAEKVDGTYSSLHQLSPYIGKLKPNIARELITSYSKPGQIVVDPFCGSGTVPLEAFNLDRHVIASDSNPYAYVLTKAKLNPPESLEKAIQGLEYVYSKAMQRPRPNMAAVPDWVGKFFHPRTLSEVIVFADECITRRQWFLLACLMGILHHQRPGFLSYPSSHLVPYLRDKSFPRLEFPEMYEYRDLLPRMRAKIGRAFKTFVAGSRTAIVRRSSIEGLTLPDKVDAIITSPPYMNALDYRRDNRLRLWLLDRSTLNYSGEPTDRKIGLKSMVSALVSHAQNDLKNGGYLVLVVGESVVRKRLQSHPSVAYLEALESGGLFDLENAIRDHIPDIRRSRRSCQATKAEHILVFRKRR
ncbi:DNA methyltransferase [Burkholderia vietnamiensis]|uniref:DNA methyltransferase n=1 Tax=Burkholderia vietnamiensis TaxID=60552 RepID=UPI001B8E2C1B|nr:DNA adenine methylase [Burkholderia vietnamiensis]